MTCLYPDLGSASYWLKLISALVTQTSFCEGSSGDLVKQLCSQASSFRASFVNFCKLSNSPSKRLATATFCGSVAPFKSLYFHWTAICSSSIAFTPRSLFLLFVLLFSGLIVEDLTTAATSPTFCLLLATAIFSVM